MMTRRDEGWAAALLALAMGGAVAIGIAQNITAPLCEANAIEALAPNQVGFGCFEFWLNRYQGLLGNLITALVAGVTLRWLARQLVAADRQVAAADRQADVAASQALRVTNEEIVRERGEIEAAIYASATAVSIYQRIVGDVPNVPMMTAISDLDECRKQLSRLTGEIEEKAVFETGASADRLRAKLLEHLRSIQADCSVVARLLGRCLDQGIWDRNDPVRVHLDKAWDQLADHHRDAVTAANHLRNELRAATVSNRKIIRAFEDRARKRL